MSPWDRYTLRWFELPDGSGGTSVCGDIRIHDEFMIEAGDINRGLVYEVLTHSHYRYIARWMKQHGTPANEPLV